MHDHKYNGCEHKIEYCSHCDVAYCTKCSREWGTRRTLIKYIQPELQPYYVPAIHYKQSAYYGIAVGTTAKSLEAQASLSSNHNH